MRFIPLESDLIYDRQTRGVYAKVKLEDSEFVLKLAQIPTAEEMKNLDQDLLQALMG